MRFCLNWSIVSKLRSFCFIKRKMGILQLSKVISENCPDAIKSADIKSYTGCKVAIDASMSIYQFLIAVRQEGNALTNAEGETTSHLMGIFYRTLRMIDNGIKPIYVFDGKPPSMKSGELLKRTERREDAEKKLAEAEKDEDVENVEKYSKRLVKVLPEHNEACKVLLDLMGIPFITAPCEAEAQCSALVRAGKAFAVGTEDMDALTFGGNILLRYLTFSEAKKMPIKEYNLEKILIQMELSMAQFIDLCILLGCDYCPSIRGIGPKKAVEFIKKYGTIEKIVENIDQTKYPLPEQWNYAGARALFTSPDVADLNNVEIKWKLPDEEGIVKFMCEKNNFNEDRIRNGIKRLIKARTTNVQCRIDSFFTKPAESFKQKVKPEIKRKGVKLEEKNTKKAKIMKGGKPK